MRVFVIEFKTTVKRPVWGFLLAGFSALLFWGKLFPSFSLEGYPLGPKELFSLGEWGRSLLLVLETWGGSILSLFVALLNLNSFASEVKHRDTLWSTPKGQTLWIAGARLAAITSGATLFIALGAGFAFLNSSTRRIVVVAGWQYLPLYLTLTWIRVTIWVAFSMFLYYLTCTRWIPVLILLVLQLVSYLTVARNVDLNFLRLIHRNLLSWNFLGPFSPLGIIPALFALQGILVMSLTGVLLGAALQVQAWFPGCRKDKNTLARVTVTIGILCLAALGSAIVLGLKKQIAPFTADELWQGRGAFERPWIWSKDFRLLTLPGKYMAVRLPSGAPIPGWLEKRVTPLTLHRYEDVGIVKLQAGLASQTLILAYPSGQPYPPEFEGIVRLFLHESQPLLKRSKIWLDDVNIAFVWPTEWFFMEEIFFMSKGLVIPLHILSPKTEDAWTWLLAWALTAASGLDDITRCYLSLYLMAGKNANEVDKALAWLQWEAAGRSLTELQSAIAAEVEKLAETDKQTEFSVQVQTTCLAPRFLCQHAHMKPEAAQQILSHWQKGNNLGHENYIKDILKERRND